MKLTASARAEIQLLSMEKSGVVLKVTMPNQKPVTRALLLGEKYHNTVSLVIDLDQVAGTTVEVDFDS